MTTPTLPELPGGAWPDSASGPADATAAIECVLRAERDAAAAIEERRARAAARIAAAHAAAAQLRERAEGVAQAIHGRTDTRVGRRLARLARPESWSASPPDALAAAVAAAAAHLTDDDDG